MILHAAPPPSAASVEIEIPFHDVDLLQVVWHGHYWKYLELARTQLLRAHRIDAPDLLELGYRFYVAESHLRHVYPMRYAERLVVRAWFGDAETRIPIAYDLWNVTQDRRCAQGSTVLVTTTADGALCFETPAPILARIRHAPGVARAS
jgi:acyl-CoA thioester hydrolase